MSGPAVPLRAYLESYRIAQFTGDIGTAYPGFDRAVPPASPPNSNASTRSELVNIRPQPETGLFGPPGRFFGNEFFHVLELTPIEGGYRAYVCDGLYKIFREGERGRTSTCPSSAMTPGTLAQRRQWHEGVAGGVHR